MATKPKIFLPEEVIVGETYRAVLALTAEQEQARSEIIAILGERPDGAAGREWGTQYHQMCTDEGVPTTENDIPFDIKLVHSNTKAKRVEKNLKGDLDRIVRVTCADYTCSVKEEMPRSAAPGWRCEAHQSEAKGRSGMSIVTSKRQQFAS